MTATPSHSERLDEDDIDQSYEVAMPFESRDATINLIDHGDAVEILIVNIPVPHRYYMNYKAERDDKEKIKQHGVARWILDDAATVLEGYDWKTSSHKANSGNRYLKDVYFTCSPDEVDDAVLAAKQFLNQLEADVVRQRRRLEGDHGSPPSEDLFD